MYSKKIFDKQLNKFSVGEGFILWQIKKNSQCHLQTLSSCSDFYRGTSRMSVGDVNPKAGHFRLI